MFRFKIGLKLWHYW